MPARKVTAAKKSEAPKSVSLPVPSADPELSEGAKRMLKQAENLTIVTAHDYEAAAVTLQVLTAREKEVAAKKAELWDPLAKLTKAVQALFNPPLKVLEQAKKTVSEKMGAYAQEQRNIAMSAQARANEEAEETREKLLDKAERANKNGEEERAYVLEQRALHVFAPTVEVDIPHVSGVQLRERWLFEVTNADNVPREYMTVDEKKIRAAVNSSEGQIHIPGVRIWSALKAQG